MTLHNAIVGVGAWVIVNVFLVGFLVVEKWLQERDARRRAAADPFTQWERDFESVA
jgi:hypothetical protein